MINKVTRAEVKGAGGVCHGYDGAPAERVIYPVAG